MIARIAGKLIEQRDHAVIIDVGGLFYEVIVPASVKQRINDTKDSDGNVHLITYYYFQIGPASGQPFLIGFINEIERDFFLQFIKVSGIGPRAAVKALDKPIADITRAIDSADTKYLQTLPGIGAQRAKEIVAKLQGKIGKFGLIQDHPAKDQPVEDAPDWHQEVLAVLLQLQYKRVEASDMIEKALKRNKQIQNSEDLLNEIYKQKVKG